MKLLRMLVLGLLIAIPRFAAYGQQTTGEVTGTVTDSSGAVVPGATVTATNNDTHQVRTTISNGSGNYTLPYLTPGNYTIACKRSGFKLARNSSIAVTVGAVVALNFKMEVGAVTEQVEVTTAAPLLSTESTAVETNIGSQQIVALPLNGRDYTSLVALSPNVENEEGSQGASGVQTLMGGARSLTALAVSGQRLEFNHYTLDGVENTDPDFNTYIIHPGVDALQEFTVLTGVYSAEYGRGAAQINATTLPGGNTYHGVAFDFMRNGAADAEAWRQLGQKPQFHRQDYGFVLDGPLSIPRVFNGKNRLFFASSFEVDDDHEGIQQFASVPTEDMRAGNFSDFGVPAPGTAPKNGQIPQIYFPHSQVGTGSSATACPVSSGGSYANGVCTVSGTLNVIPSSITLSSIGKTLLSYEPLPNLDGGPSEETSYANNYVSEAPFISDATQFNQRIDFTQNARSNWFGRFSWENDLYVPASVFGTATSTYTNTTVRQAVMGNTFTISPHVVNEARFGWDQFNNSSAGYYSGGSDDVQAGLGITGLSAPSSFAYGLPSISWTDFTGYGGVNPYISYDDIFQWLDSVTIVKGNHTITAGGMFERDRYNEYGNQYATGTVGFSGFSTEDPAYGNVLTGFALADMEFGYVSGGYNRVAALANIQLRRPDYATFVEDDWKLRPNLTLNAGLRYENSIPWYDKHDNIWNMDMFTFGVNASAPPNRYTMPSITLIPGAQLPVFTRPGAAGCNVYAGMSYQLAEPGQPAQCGDQYMGRATVDPDNLNFGPRLGLDYALGTKWSIRSGFGIFYVQDYSNDYFDLGRNIGAKDGINNGSYGSAFTPLSSPWAYESGSSACAANQYNGNTAWSGLCEAGPQINAVYQHNRTPYVEQYILHVERQLTQNVAVDVGYEGSESHHLYRYFLGNEAVPKSGPTDTSSIASRRPFPAYGLFQMARDWDQAAYNSGDVKVTQRFSHGFLYVLSFTWSRSLDYGSGVRIGANDTLWPVYGYNPKWERGPSAFNLPRRFVASWVYELPFGANKQFAPSNPVVNHIVSGWTWGGILTLEDGTSMNATSLGDTASLGGTGNNPEYVGLGPYRAAHPTPSAYWNAAAWAGAYTSPLLQYQEGDMSRTNLYTPGFEDFDTNIARDFHIWESHTLQARFEVFNTLNHPNWSVPLSTNPTVATFGEITTAGPMRELQAALKYSF